MYDADRRCGDDQLEIESDRCVCQPGFVARAGGCVACAEHEVAQGGSCVCAPDYGRSTDTSPCESCAAGEVQLEGRCSCAPGSERDALSGTCISGGLGATCTGDGDCAEAAYPSCRLADGASGYCTVLGCIDASECGIGFACEASEAPSFCRRPPLGQGSPCTTSADCTGTQATYCDTFVSNVCLVEGCTPGGSECFTGWSCCDLAGLGLDVRLCVTDASCPSQ